MPAPGTQLKLEALALERLGAFICEVLSSLESEHAPLERRIERLWDVYEAKPLVERRSTPWDGASNIVVPAAQTWGEAIVARHFSRLTSTKDFWIASTENEQWKDAIGEWLRYLNWGARGNIFDMFLPVWDGLSEMVPLGSSHWALSWRECYQLRYTPRSAKLGKPQRILASRGPRVEQVARQDLIIVPGSSPLDSEVVCRRRWMTRAEFLMFAETAQLDPAVVEDVLAAPDTDSDSSRKRGDVRAGYAGSAGSIPLWDIREVWIDYPMLKSGRVSDMLRFDESDPENPPVPLLVHLHRGTEKVLRVSTHPYFFTHKPFYDIHFNKRPGRQDSTGVAARADHLQRAVTTMLNQSIDAVTLANSVSLLTSDKRLVNMRFSPGVPILTDSMDAVRELTLSKQVIPDLNLINFVIATGERLFSTGDPALGRETRMGGHPAPATSTLALLEQLSINVSVSLRFIRHRLSKLGEDTSTLFQQYEADDVTGRISKALGARDAQLVNDIIFPLDEPISGNVHFDVHALSEIQSPEAQRQTAVLEDQMITNYFSQALGVAQILSNPQLGQNPMIREISLRALHAKTMSMKRFLDTTGFDVPEEILIDLNRSDNAAALAKLSALATGALGQTASPGATVPIPGMEGGFGGVPSIPPGNGGAPDSLS